MVKLSNADGSHATVLDLESLQAKHIERVRKRAEKALRSLIHKEYIRRVGIAMGTLKGSPHSRSARMLEARRLTGINADEIYGGELSTEAALTIGTPMDAGRYLSETDDTFGGTIFGGLRLLRIGETAVANVVVEAHASVKKSTRLLRAELAAEREFASGANASDASHRNDTLRQLLDSKSRRRVSTNLRRLRVTHFEGDAATMTGKESYRFEEKRGSNLKEVESARCIELLRAGKAVKLETPQQEAYVRRTIGNSPSVILVHSTEEIIGVGVYKGIRVEYANRVIADSGYDFDENTPEIGYVVVAESHRNQGLGLAIVRRLCELREGPLFATTNKESMKHHLAAVRFEQKGLEWKGEEEALLSLWVRADLSK